jgi:hypothetical protein
MCTSRLRATGLPHIAGTVTLCGQAGQNFRTVSTTLLPTGTCEPAAGH